MTNDVRRISHAHEVHHMSCMIARSSCERSLGLAVRAPWSGVDHVNEQSSAALCSYTYSSHWLAADALKEAVAH